MGVENKRSFLIKYAYCSGCPHLAEHYKQLLRTANEQIIDEAYELFVAYVYPFFEKGKPIDRQTYKYDEKLRSVFNIIREQFVHLIVAAIENKRPNSKISSQFDFMTMFASFHKIVNKSGSTEAERIYRDLITNLRQQPWWKKSYEFCLLKEIYSFNGLDELVDTFDEDRATLSISINNKYVIRLLNAEMFEKTLAAVEFAYERRLIHGAEINLSKLVEPFVASL